MVRAAMASGAMAGLAVLVLTSSLPARENSKPQMKSVVKFPPRPAPPLRYAGKTFQQWRMELQTELKPELRLEAIKAMGFFGAAGHGSKAARAVIESMRGCGVVFVNSARSPNAFPEELMLMTAGHQAIGRIGPEAIPALRAGLGHANRDVRLFALVSIASIEGAAQLFAAEIVTAIDDRDCFVAQQACKFAIGLCPHERGLVSALGQAFR